MKTILLAPHADDETLFAAWTVLRHRPDVAVVLAPKETERFDEAACAVALLGADLCWLPFTEHRPDWDGVAGCFDELAARYDRCYAPSFDFEANGHVEGVEPRLGWGVFQHDMVGKLAKRVFGERTVAYCTYTRWGGRQVGVEVAFEPEWLSVKLRAMACYASQHVNEATRSWFIAPDLREWTT